jgi:hypothetical protein
MLPHFLVAWSLEKAPEIGGEIASLFMEVKFSNSAV